MSKNTIYRQDAVDAINELHDKPNAWLDLAVEILEKLPSAEPDPEWRKKHYEMAYNQGFVDACKYYENLPERKTGHWLFLDEYDEAVTHTCSECGKRMTTAIGVKASFCWNCGADMRGEQE